MVRAKEWKVSTKHPCKCRGSTAKMGGGGAWEEHCPEVQRGAGVLGHRQVEARIGAALRLQRPLRELQAQRGGAGVRGEVRAPKPASSAG